MSFSRDTLDKAATAAGLWKRVTGIVETVLAAAGLPPSAVDAVELVGGGVRVPKVQALLKEFFGAGGSNSSGGARVGTHMNGDECFALGAVFVAANRSTSLKVRKVGMVDMHPFANWCAAWPLDGGGRGGGEAMEQEIPFPLPGEQPAG